MSNKPSEASALDRSKAEKVRVVQMENYSEQYANSVQVNVNIWDFFLQFGRLKLSSTKEVIIDVFQGVYMSPQQAKALHLVLSQNIAQYESTFGEIKIDNPGRQTGDRADLVQ